MAYVYSTPITVRPKDYNPINHTIGSELAGTLEYIQDSDLRALGRQDKENTFRDKESMRQYFLDNYGQAPTTLSAVMTYDKGKSELDKLDAEINKFKLDNDILSKAITDAESLDAFARSQGYTNYKTLLANNINNRTNTNNANISTNYIPQLNYTNSTNIQSTNTRNVEQAPTTISTDSNETGISQLLKTLNKETNTNNTNNVASTLINENIVSSGNIPSIESQDKDTTLNIFHNKKSLDPNNRTNTYPIVPNVSESNKIAIASKDKTNLTPKEKLLKEFFTSISTKNTAPEKIYTDSDVAIYNQNSNKIAGEFADIISSKSFKVDGFNPQEELAKILSDRKMTLYQAILISKLQQSVISDPHLASAININTDLKKIVLDSMKVKSRSDLTDFIKDNRDNLFGSDLKSKFVKLQDELDSKNIPDEYLHIGNNTRVSTFDSKGNKQPFSLSFVFNKDQLKYLE